MSETIDINTSQDALYLWDDTMRLLSMEINSSRRVAMMNACEPLSLQDDTLTVCTPSAFAKRTLEAELQKLEGALSEAAFQPMHLKINYTRDGWRESAGLAQRAPHPNIQKAPPPSEPLNGSPAAQPKAQPPCASPSLHLESHPQSKQLPTLAPAPEPANALPLGVATTALSKDEFLDRFKNASGTRPEALNPQIALPTTDLSSQRSSLSLQTPTSPAKPAAPLSRSAQRTSKPNPLDTVLGDNDSKLTFDTFVEGVENSFALAAAKQVANGNTAQYNPLFIHGNSGIGKTHLLMAIKNYVAAHDPTRTCVYRVSKDFISDYTTAMAGNKSIKDNLTRQYRNVDILILDDVQHLSSASRTLEFFFDTFNHLISQGKQIVLAADVAPAELGMSERITSRMGQGFEVPIQMPSLELKRNLIGSFYARAKKEALPGYEGTIASTVLDAMAEGSGSNIRLIKSYVQQCLFVASSLEKKGASLTADDARAIAKEKWPHGHHQVSVEEIQALVEHEMGVGHPELVGAKRSKDIAKARHVAMWLCRQLTNLTLSEIGAHFGNRTHTTCMHSIEWVDKLLAQRTDRHLIELVTGLRERLETL